MWFKKYSVVFKYSGTKCCAYEPTRTRDVVSLQEGSTWCMLCYTCVCDILSFSAKMLRAYLAVAYSFGSRVSCGVYNIYMHD